MNQLFDFIIIINWNYAISVLLGALITGIISYFLTKNREINQLKIEVQLRVAEQLLEHIRIFKDASSHLYIKDYSIFKAYNDLLNYTEKEDNNTNKDNINIFRNKQIDAKKIINNCIADYSVDFGSYNDSMMGVCNILESKEVILNKFHHFELTLVKELRLHTSISEPIFSCLIEICHNMNITKEIGEECLKNLGDCENELKKKKYDILLIIQELSVGLQNEFLSKIFKYKVPQRRPKIVNFRHKSRDKYQPTKNRKEK